MSDQPLPPIDDDDDDEDNSVELEPLTHPPAAPSAGAKPTIDLVALRQRVEATLRERHIIHGQMAWLLLGSGIVVLMAIGFVFSFVMTLLGTLEFDNPIGFYAWFGIYLLLLIPVFIWQERRTRNGFFTFAMVDVDLRRDPENTSEYLINRSQAHVKTAIELLLWGPRAVLAGARAFLDKPQIGLERVIPEASEMLTLLLSLDGGVKIKSLVDENEDPMQLMPVLKWLDAHDYIGISSRGDRVWVSSPAKKMVLIATPVA